MSEMSGGTLLDRMVARALEPVTVFGALGPSPVAKPWGEEVVEQPAPRLSPLSEVARSEPVPAVSDPVPGEPQPPVTAAFSRPVDPLIPKREEKISTGKPSTEKRVQVISTISAPRPRELSEVPSVVEPPVAQISHSPAHIHVLPPAIQEHSVASGRPPEVIEERPSRSTVQRDLPSAIPAAPGPVAARPVADPPDQVINITIGRLEVRAAEQEKKPRVSRRATPAEPTLEQYLARRRGGGTP